MSEGAKEEKISSSVEWIAFKQQFFSSVLIARDDFLYADVAYDTASPDSGLIKAFSAAMAVPYTAQTEQYELLVLLRSQQVRRVEEDRRRAGPIAAARPADPHGLGHYRVGEPLAGDPRLRFPAAVYSELRLDHPHPGDPHQDHRFAADLQELYLAGQDAHHQTRDRRPECQVSQAGRCDEEAAGDDGPLQEGGHQSAGRVHPDADPAPDPDRHVPFLPLVDRVAGAVALVGARPVVVRQHLESALLRSPSTATT